MSKRKYILTIVGATLVSGGLLFAGNKALAEDADTYPVIVENLAEKFDLNPEEVEEVFTVTRDEERSLRLENRLSALVDEGTITEEQKSLISAKMEEHHNAMDEIDTQSMTMSERRSAMENLKTELEDWAEQNDIPLSAMMGVGRMGGRGEGRGMGMGMGMGQHMGRFDEDPELLVE